VHVVQQVGETDVPQHDAVRVDTAEEDRTAHFDIVVRGVGQRAQVVDIPTDTQHRGRGVEGHCLDLEFVEEHPPSKRILSGLMARVASKDLKEKPSPLKMLPLTFSPSTT